MRSKLMLDFHFRGVVLVVALSLSALLAAAPKSFAQAPDRIAFVRNSDIWVMDPYGGHLQRLTTNKASNLPTWNKDHTRMAFISGRNSNQHVWVMDVGYAPDGSVVPGVFTQLTNFGGWDYGPELSPDGTQVVYQATRDGNPEIYVVNVTTGAYQNLTNDPGNDSWPTWSPDGQFIVFTSNRTGTGTLHYLHLDATTNTWAYGGQLTDSGGTPVHGLDAAWSPVSTQISPSRWTSKIALGSSAISTIDVVEDTQAGTLTLVSGSQNQLTTDGGFATWSPGGDRIAYRTVSGLFIVSLTGGSSPIPNSKNGDDKPAWSR